MGLQPFLLQASYFLYWLAIIILDQEKSIIFIQVMVFPLLSPSLLKFCSNKLVMSENFHSFHLEPQWLVMDWCFFYEVWWL